MKLEIIQVKNTTDLLPVTERKSLRRQILQIATSIWQ